MILGWPQIVLLVLLAMGTGLHMAKDGQPRTDRYSFWWALFSDGLLVWLLYAGGFWTGGG